VRQLKHLCRDDTGALDAIDRATVGEHENQHTRPRVQDNNVIVQQGTSNTYALRKLRKDRPDLHERDLRSARNTPENRLRNLKTLSA
jgi:hypothetical protein